ncbi:hypothetical protein THAOC_05014 [Thalassiosira oceanica]|uniref:Uncharacterized protein n=1 Tax=Thalassiosira oceanica TaxID=159749 RepID=K0T6S0_THAOC|nr:hypothetical protein THAOC_05014 [Thalassiosira oceanica]|mmetsp:Transcript_14307/g.33345  ORF Transcript_14307/g.33345 Transcript_14307/m.33345 type:complete len:470 (+) Transcript_14307:163-1572(+)|eukprot:EJK73365.1 hypothetical protein THAOC_05014 [Thalassiosira oceanica]
MSSGALFTLQCGKTSVATGVCFVRDSAPPPTETDSDNDTDSGESVSAGSFRCSNLLPRQCGHSCADVVQTSSDGEKLSQFYQQASQLSASSHEALKGYTLASCHGDGSCKLWDLATRRCIEEDICKENRKSGLAVRRLGSGNNNSFLYQSRDRLGTVSLHHSQHPSTPVVTMPTYSTSFCTMSPCQTECAGSSASNLVALPTADHSVAIVRDIRCNPEGNPAWRVDLTVGRKGAAAPYGKFGMATSLALCEYASTIVLGAGMEDGSALFHDLGAVGNGRRPWYVGEEALKDYGMEATRVGEEDLCSCAVSLGKDPVLSIDLVPPPRAADDPKQVLSAGSLVAVGGCAGDELSRQDDALGTVSTVTVNLADDATRPMEASIRVRSRTCSINSGGKSGVSVCRFRPDSKMFAVGGWDYRLRLFSRSKSKALAILRGHEKSVTSCDWADDASVSGLLATCADDGRICVWRVV